MYCQSVKVFKWFPSGEADTEETDFCKKMLYLKIKEVKEKAPSKSPAT